MYPVLRATAASFWRPFIRTFQSSREFPVDVPLNVIFLKHTLEFADIEAVFTMTMFRKCHCEPVATTRRVAAFLRLAMRARERFKRVGSSLLRNLRIEAPVLRAVGFS